MGCKDSVSCAHFQQYINSQQQLLQRMSHAKLLLSPGGPVEEYSKSSSKRLFESVFRILDHDDLEISAFDQADTNGARVSTMLSSQPFLQSLHLKIKQDNLLDTYPILKVQCRDRKGHVQPIDLEDLAEVFAAFSNLYSVISSKSQLAFYAVYTTFPSAYVAMKLLNGFTLRHSLSQLFVHWCAPSDYDNLSQILAGYHSKVEWVYQGSITKESSNSDKQNINISNNGGNGSTKQCKLTCRYDIQIQNQKQFQVARRIIGAKGINMKKIIEGALEPSEKTSPNSNQLLKLRLRGRGSGYKEGPEQLESEEELHLCISAKYESIYNKACESVENLLNNVYTEYEEFTRRQGQTIRLEIKKSELSSQTSTSSEPVTKTSTTLPIIGGRMEASKIEQFLELRNKARRELNFGEADRIRNYLRACGVCLIDEKGRRGKATEVTTWKYLL